jgi:osmotically-inducible protein OsmY
VTTRASCAPRAWAVLLILTGAPCGCAVYDAYEKCGFHGCPGDAKITAEIRSQLNQCPFLEPNAIRVQTLDHVVFLDGVVSSGLEIGAAESIAGKVPGVARVMNSIVVSTAR